MIKAENGIALENSQHLMTVNSASARHELNQIVPTTELQLKRSELKFWVFD
jgi:hypothetical protein